MKLIIDPQLAKQLISLYKDMERAYDQVAKRLGFSCDGCPDNCCNSYFLHHTYIEWCYLWEGMHRLPPAKQSEIIERAVAYERECEMAMKSGERPCIMCPLNESGRCILYEHRLMVCRTHGVPATMTRPDGQRLHFPGCFRCQHIVENTISDPRFMPVMERTDLLRRLVGLEQRILEGKRHLLPKPRMTIACMLTSGPPVVTLSAGKKRAPE